MIFQRKPLDADKINVVIGEVHIIKDRCKGCSFCIEYCPRDVLELSEEFNIKGYHPPRIKNPDNCAECHLCEMLCPEFAIYVTKKEDAKTPVH